MDKVIYGVDDNSKIVLKYNSKDTETGNPLISKADFEEEKFNGYLFENVSFELCTFDETDFYNSKFRNVTFFGVSMIFTKFVNCRFENVEFYGVFGLNNNFENAEFTKVNFRGTTLKLANFRNAKLNTVGFFKDNIGSTTSIDGAKFASASIQNVTLVDVEYTDRTQFSDSINPGLFTGLIKCEK